MSARDWDHIIIGGGSAGCALAYRLSSLTGARILLLEAGPADRSPLVHVPAGSHRTIGDPGFDWAYTTEPDASRDGVRQQMYAGRVLGGGSAINGMIYTRGAAEDFDDWAAGGAEGWAYDNVLPFFQRAETYLAGDPRWRGHSGPLQVEAPRTVHPSTRLFMEAAAQIGWPVAPDYNGPSQEGAAIAQLTQHRGARSSTAVAYRPLRKPGLTVRTGAVATRLILEGGRCTGVTYRWRGAAHEARAGSVVVSAGAVASPKLLMLSGIGDRAELAAHGIETQVHLPGVGRNFVDHIGAGVGVHVSIPTWNSRSGPLDVAWAALEWLTVRRGPATTPLCQAVAFCRSGPQATRPDLQMMFSPLATEMRGDKIVPYGRDAVGIFVDLGRPNQRGQVSLRSANPLDKPRIAFELMGDPDDVAMLIHGCRLARELFETPALRGVVLDERFPGASVRTDAQWREALKGTTSMFHHTSGTCAIGRDDKAVVDSELRVHGVDGLRVADASVMPRPINGNTNAATIMIGERCAAWLAG